MSERKKKIAILFSGYIRTLTKNFSYLKKSFNENHEYDMFVITPYNGNETDRYVNYKNDIEKIIKMMKPVVFLYTHESDKNFISDDDSLGLHKNILLMWEKLNLINEIKSYKEKKENFRYDLVVRMRPDVCLGGKINFDEIIDLSTDGSIIIPKLNDNSTSHMSSSREINEHIAFSTSESMNIYSDIYYHALSKFRDNIYSNPESILAEYLFEKNMKIKEIDLEYALVLSECSVITISGDSGSGKTYLSKILKKIYNGQSLIVECDRYHKWERGNSNWEKYTHLNPEANYLCKMSQDVYDLKMGKNIIQVEYDHLTGKFTEPMSIGPEKNIIICGLHALYDDSINRISDLKIYINTDENLRFYWKLIRDQTERGHDTKKIISSIRRRTDDKKKFIDPQKSHADLIISYKSNLNMDLIKISETTSNDEIFTKKMDGNQINIELTMSVSDKYDMSVLDNFLNEMDFDFLVSYKHTNGYHHYILNNHNIDKNNILKFVMKKKQFKNLNDSSISSGKDGIIQLFVLYLL